MLYNKPYFSLWPFPNMIGVRNTENIWASDSLTPPLLRSPYQWMLKSAGTSQRSAPSSMTCPHPSQNSEEFLVPSVNITAHYVMVCGTDFPTFGAYTLFLDTCICAAEIFSSAGGHLVFLWYLRVALQILVYL